MPQTIAPVSVPVMPTRPPAHSQTTAADGDFAAVFHGHIPAKQAATSKNASFGKQAAEKHQETQDPSQTGIGAASVAAGNNLQEASAIDEHPTAFPAGFAQNFAGDGAAGKMPDIFHLGKTLPQLTTSKSITGHTGQEAAAMPTTQRGGSFLMSELRRLVESHDPRATVSLERGGKATLQDMPTLAVAADKPASAAAIMTPATTATPKAKTLHSIAAPLSTAGENSRVLSGKSMADKRESAAAAAANDKRQVGDPANKDGKTAERMPQTASQTASPTALSGRAAAAADDAPAFNQAVQAAATTDGAASVVRPGQPLAAGVAIMQQVIDHIRDLPRPLPNRISLQLHPAELGQLKINLTMQEGVIRASVVTQTVQAQEILEKHMPRLRSLLEKQGLALEDVRIAQENNPITGLAFFEQGHSSPRGEDSGAKGRKTAAADDHGGPGFAQALTRAGFDQHANNGLNIHA